MNVSGWRWSDGTIDPPPSAQYWGSKKHRGAHPLFDCALQFMKIVQSRPCRHTGFGASPVCQPRSQLSTADRYKNVEVGSIPVGLRMEEFADGDGCSKLLTEVESKIKCAAFCNTDPNDSCVSFYFNRARKECRLVLYTDATIDMGDARGWKKFITKK